MRHLPLIVLAIGCIGLISSCAPHKKHQASYPHVKINPIAPNTSDSTTRIAVIEFDEQGDFWDQRQLTNAVEMIGDAPTRPLVVTFVHGWRHDARQNDEDLMQFRKFVEDLDSIRPEGFSVRGVYVGWRGASIEEKYGAASTLPALLTFWNRKHATDRIANIRLSQTLSRISATAWKNNGRSVAMGHSFGGRILERTAGMGSVAQSGNLERFNPVADLVVLINPASESLNARTIKLGLRGWERDYPLFVAIGAKNDNATGKAWTWGFRIGPNPMTRNYNDQKESQSEYLSQTVTNDRRQFTHVLKEWAGAAKPAEGRSASENLGGLSSEEEEAFNLRTAADGSRQSWKLVPVVLTKVDKANHVIGSKAYWALQVPTTVLSGHSGDRSKGGVFCAPMTDLLYAIFSKAQLEERKSREGPKVPIARDEGKVAPQQDFATSKAQENKVEAVERAQVEDEQPLPTTNRLKVVTATEVVTFGDFAAAHGTSVAKLNALNGHNLDASTVLAAGSEFYLPTEGLTDRTVKPEQEDGE